jgi:tRNA threonylcarbamoyladenosine biosynthesis protein TsaE
LTGAMQFPMIFLVSVLDRALKKFCPTTFRNGVPARNGDVNLCSLRAMLSPLSKRRVPPQEIGNGKPLGGSPPGISGSKLALSWAETLIKLLKMFLANLEATKRLGNSLSQSLGDDGALIALSGELGAGKTTLVKALAAGLGINELVTSPTFLTMNEYIGGRLPLYHLDLYRFADSRRDLSFFAHELDELSLKPCVIVVEWAEFFLLESGGKELNFFYKQDHLKIKFQHISELDSARHAIIDAEGTGAVRILEALSKLSADMLIYS